MILKEGGFISPNVVIEMFIRSASSQQRVSRVSNVCQQSLDSAHYIRLGVDAIKFMVIFV